MKKVLCTTLFILLGAALWSAVSPAAAGATTSIEREFRYDPGRFGLTRNADGTTQVGMSGATREFTPGRPDLPLVGERVTLPVGQRLAAVEIVDLELASLAHGVRLPSAQLLRPGLDSLERTAPDPAFFGRSGFVPEQLAQVGMQGFERGQVVAYVLIAPARWNPATGELERVARVRVRLVLEPTAERPLERERVVPEWEDGGLDAAASGTRAARPSALVGGARQAAPFKATQLPSVLGSPVAYVIVTSDAMAPAFQQLADWKTQCGVPAVVRTLSFIKEQYPYGADDAERVRLFIRDAYSRWGAKWVLLGGDTDVIPTRFAYTTYYGSEHIATDMYFSCLDGNWNANGNDTYGEGVVINPPSPGDSCDLLPEVYVGRLPATTLAEAQLLVNKAMKYEKQPVADYINNVLFFAEVLFPQDWEPGQGTSLDGAELIDYDMLPIMDTVPTSRSVRLYENYTDARWRPGSLPETKQVVLDSLNLGYNVAVHVGHGYRNVMHVADDDLTNADATGLTNGDRLINLYAINCSSTSIDFPCISEAFMKAPNGGTASIVGSTRYDFPTYGRMYQQEFFKLLYQQNVTAVGEAQTKQKLPYAAQSNGDGVHRWTQMTLVLLGDPELHIWTATPRTLGVTHVASLPMSDTTLTVGVTAGGSPLDSARVTVYRADHVFATALTDAAGNVTLPVRPDTLGPLTLTVTGFNCRPYQASVAVVAGGAPVLAQRSVRVDDSGAGGTTGNGDGIWDAGETVALYPVLRNNGGSAAASLTGTLRTTDGVVTLLQPAAAYGTIAAGDSAGPVAGLRVSVPYTTEDQREIPFELRLVDGAGRSYVERFQVTVRAPDLRHFAHGVIDGNSNGQPDAGETVSYYVKLRNLGTGVAQGVTARLRSLDGLATVSDSMASWGDIQPGQEVAGDALTFVPTSLGATLLLVVGNEYGERLRQTIDLVYPVAPTGLLGSGAAGGISLGWTKTADADLLGYNVYRSTLPAGPFVRENRVPTDRTAYYLDDGLLSLTRYYYKVSAVDQSGNESALSAPVSASTNPPLHSIFPFPTGRETPAPVAVDHVYEGFPLDVVAGSDYLYVWHPDGTAPVDADGSGATPGDFTNLGSYYAGGPSIADLDGGTKEIIGATWNDMKVYVFDTAGQPKPGWPVQMPITSPAGIWTGVAVGDLRGDGQKALVLGSNGTYVYALRANGTEWMDGDSNPATFGVFKVVGGAYNYSTPALAPLEGGTQLDIVFVSTLGQLFAWRPDGTDVPGFPVWLSGGSSASVAVGSLDGPGGPLSIIVPTTNQKLYAFNANGTVRSGFPVTMTLSGNSKIPSPALADMNGDGYLEIVQACTNGVINVVSRTGALLAPWSGTRYSTLTASSSESSPVVADINGDGVLDIVIGEENGQLTAISGADASILPGFPIQLAAEVKGAPAVCDCDGDGKTEIVVAGWDRNVYMWDYDFAFSPGAVPPWPQFHHDAARTGYAGTAVFAGTEDGATVLPRTLELAAPSPNPARAGARLWYGVPADRAGGQLELAIFDLSGRRVRVLQSGRAEAGRRSASWDLRDASGAPAEPGVYFARLALGSEARSRKLVVVR